MRSDYESACVMNVITYRNAYCLYPKATLRDKVNLILKKPNELIRSALRKYEGRGFTNRTIANSFTRFLFHEREVRWIRDGKSWVLKLPDIDFSTEALNRIDPVSTTTWSLATYPMDYHRIHFHIVDDEPSITPLIVAHHRLEQYVIEIISDNEDVIGEGDQDRTATGSDA